MSVKTPLLGYSGAPLLCSHSSLDQQRGSVGADSTLHRAALLWIDQPLCSWFGGLAPWHTEWVLLK